ncbi:hypothetical protein AB0B66_02450 [Catellatospora sp. NPDC049111]|uniref:hypothetical protein n=1 Tax=Catellatospora sp. NPDC049111 TaxID=3155271 RepID=UPI0033F95074
MTARISLVWLAHPVSLLALALLLVNDHVLKAAWPGTATGKLSDFAGLLVAPPLLAVLVTLCAPRLPSRAVAVGATVAVGVGFAAVKSSGTAAAAASALWTVVAGPSTVRADLTDLLALPALLGALAVWRHARTRPAPTRLARAVRVVVVLPVALLGVAATSADTTGEHVSIGTDNSGALVVRAERGDLRSTDGGRTFTPYTFTQELPFTDFTGSQAEHCVAEQPICYRVGYGRLRVERSDDDRRTWTVAWELPERTRELLEREHSSLFGTSGVRSYGLVTFALRDGGHVVAVANGHDGVLVRDVTGTWTRIGDGRDPAAPLPSGLLPVDQWFAHIVPEVLWGLLAMLLCLVAGTVVALYRANFHGSAVTTGVLTLLGPCLIVAGLAVPLGTGSALLGDVSPVLVLGGVAALVLVPVVTLSIGLGRRVMTARGLLLPALVGVAVYVPYVVWGSGATTNYQAAALAALVVFVLGLVGVIVTAAVARRPPAPEPAPWPAPVYPAAPVGEPAGPPALRAAAPPPADTAGTDPDAGPPGGSGSGSDGEAAGRPEG